MVEVIDFYVTGWPLLIVAVFEIVTICYIYGTVFESYIQNSLEHLTSFFQVLSVLRSILRS